MSSQAKTRWNLLSTEGPLVHGGVFAQALATEAASPLPGVGAASAARFGAETLRASATSQQPGFSAVRIVICANRRARHNGAASVIRRTNGASRRGAASSWA